MANMLAQYETLIANGELQVDVQQREAVIKLDALQSVLEAPEPKGLRKFFAKSVRPRGIYVWGDVGRGKSMVMDLFHDTLAVEPKRRAHFHAFMQEVHALLRDARSSETGDPIPPVAAKLSGNGTLRCLAFDEMVINNSADAMIMSRLFRALIMDQGVTIVTTSNRAPSELYKNGLNREHFLPFIALLEQELDILTLNGPKDYRLDRIGGMETWYTPLGDAATQSVREAFFRLTDFQPEDAERVPSAELDVGGGRLLHVPKSLKGVGVFSFKRLCGEARGAPDYLAIARHYHSIILVGIPQMGADMRNEAARFVTLIDALYEHKVKLFATAASEPEDLYQSGDGHFEFARTVSRLREMQSDSYMAEGHGV